MIESAILSALKATAKLNQDREKVLMDKINELQSKINKPNNFAEAASRGLPKEHRQAIASQVATQVKQIEQRAYNVVVIGIKESDDASDSDKVKNFFSAADVRAEELNAIRNVRRLKKGNNTITSNLILVSLSNQDARSVILDKCRHHRLEGEHQQVFAREDRTPAEQFEFNKTREQARRRNKELEDDGLLDRPFRYIIHRRTGKVDLIDVVESSRLQKYVFKRAADVDTAKSERTTTAAAGATGNRGVENTA